MNKAYTIAKHWEDFNEQVIPKNAPEVQRREMKIAFFAGAGVLMTITAALGDENIPETAGVAILESLDREIRDFAMDPSQFGPAEPLVPKIIL